MLKETLHREEQPESKAISPLVEKPVPPLARAPVDVAATTPASSQDVLFREPDLSTGLVIRNLLNDLDGLAAFLRTAIHQSDWLNAFLLSAGIWQIVEDYLHSDPLSLQRAEKVFEGLHHPLINTARSSVWLTRQMETGLFQRLPRYRRVLRWSALWKELVEALAEAAVSVNAGRGLPAESEAGLIERSRALLADSEDFPTRLRRSILRLPNCFRSFDQRPEDIQRLAAKFAKQYPDRNQPVVVVGLRTSGNYLAPLLKCYLHREGYQDITVTTLRPGIDLLPFEKAQIHRANRQGTLFALIDDPPVTGRSMLKAARRLERVHVSRQSIVLMVPLFAGPDSLPARLRGFTGVLLPWEEWAIQDLTSPEAMKDTLSGWLLPGLEITRVEQTPIMRNDTGRGHITRVYRVTVSQPASGLKWRREILAKGVGLGYLGDHVQDMLRHLSPHFPPVYGLRDGLLSRAWIPEEDQIGGLPERDFPAAARGIATYVWDRHRQLSVAEDVSLRRFGNSPAWEVTSDLISHVFGRAWKVARVPLVDPVMRRLLHASSPSLVDGNMALSNWFYRSAQNQLTKVAFERGVFRNDVEYTSYDPVFDLASLAADLEVAAVEGKEWAKELSSLIRRDYEQLSGDKIDEERWLLYQFVRLWEVKRTIPMNRTHILTRAYSRALQRYFSAYYFQDLPANPHGDICAFDLDGVLETNYLGDALLGGLPALSPASAVSLRALARHGYRSIVTTGRSLPEVIERCQHYPIVGGVAEYGAVIYSPAQGTQVLLSDGEQEALDGLRKYLQSQPCVFVDPDYRYAVRAYQVDFRGRRLALSADQIAGALRSQPSGSASLRPIAGEKQTDFMVERIDKAVGARELLANLTMGGDGRGADSHPLALAVGDSLSDLPVLEMAKRAVLPAHASPRLNRPGIRRYRTAYQAGLAQAVTDLIGHSPRDCEECQPPTFSENARYLLGLFAVQENGAKSILLSLISRMRP